MIFRIYIFINTFVVLKKLTMKTKLTLNIDEEKAKRIKESKE